MEMISGSKASGFDLITTDKMHFSGNGKNATEKSAETDSFAKILLEAVDNVNVLQQNSDDLKEQMLIDPENINVDEVIIASEKARLSVTYFKSITEKAMKAYNEIMSIR